MSGIQLNPPSERPIYEVSNISPVLFGNNLPVDRTEVAVNYVRADSSNQKKLCNEDPIDEFQDTPGLEVFVIQMLHHERSEYLPSPAPPPKLHYTTFWKSLTRRAYHKRQQEIQRLARESILSETEIIT